MAMSVLVHDQERMYELLSDEAGGIYLSVLCGGIAMYEVTIKLNVDEMGR